MLRPIGGPSRPEASRFSENSTSLGARDSELEVDKVDESVCLPSQLIGNHRGCARHGRDHGDTYTPALHGLYQRTEVAVAREKHHGLKMLGKLHCVYRKVDAGAAVLSATTGVSESLYCLGDDSVTIIIQPVDERSNGGILRVDDGRIIKS